MENVPYSVIMRGTDFLGTRKITWDSGKYLETTVKAEVPDGRCVIKGNSANRNSEISSKEPEDPRSYNTNR